MDGSNKEILNYRDLYFRLFAAFLASHFIVIYGEPESTFEILLTKEYYRAFAGCFLIALLLIQYVHLITRFLDRRFEQVSTAMQRMLYQFVLGILLPGIGAFLLAALYFKIRGVNILHTTYVVYDFYYILLMLALINAYYLCYHFYLKYQQVAGVIEQEAVQEQVVSNEVFLVDKGSIPIPVAMQDIAYFFRAGEANYLRTVSNEDLFVALSLDEIEQQLDKQQFFRINRQLIANYRAIDLYKPIAYGKLEVPLNPAFPIELIVSQKRAKTFKKWLDVQKFLLDKTFV